MGKSASPLAAMAQGAGCHEPTGLQQGKARSTDRCGGRRFRQGLASSTAHRSHSHGDDTKLPPDGCHGSGPGRCLRRVVCCSARAAAQQGAAAASSARLLLAAFTVARSGVRFLEGKKRKICRPPSLPQRTTLIARSSVPFACSFTNSSSHVTEITTRARGAQAAAC